MSTTKILYKTKKWDKEVNEMKKVKAIDLNLQNIDLCIRQYTNPDSLYGSQKVIRDVVSFYHLLGGKYSLFADKLYLLNADMNGFLKYIYLSVKSYAMSYENEKAGVQITNSAIERAHKTERNLEEAMFCAASIGKLELFEQYGNNLGCEIIKAMYHEDYEKAEELVTQLPDTAEIYEKEKYWASYCYESKYLKALYQTILSKDEKAFNKALADRIKFIRKGYVMPVDVVSVTMIKFARKLGMDYNFDVIEIPKALLEDLSDVPFEDYQLPEV